MSQNEHGSVLPATDATRPLRVLVPLDGSDLSETALTPAAQLIEVNAHIQGYLKYVLANHWNPQLFAAITAPFQGEVHLLRVVDLPSVYGKLKNQAHITDVMQEEVRQEEEQEAEKYVKSVAERCETAFAGFNLKVSSSVAVSTDVAGTIIEEAEQARDGESALSYDMIAMATHGKGVLQRLFMGSVTQHVLDTTKLPLLIVRPQQAETGGKEPGDTLQVEAEVKTWTELL